MTVGPTTGPSTPAPPQNPPPGQAAQSPQPSPSSTAAADYWKDLRKDAKPLLAALRLVEAHPWLMVVMVAAVIAIKVLGVSEGDVATAGVILGSGGFSGLTSIIALSIFPTAAAGAFIVLGAMAFGVAGASGGHHWHLPAYVAGAFGLLTAVLVPALIFAGIFVTMLVLGVGLLLYNIWKKRSHARKVIAAAANNTPAPAALSATFGGGGRREFAAFVVMVIPIAILSSATAPTMWLPTEQITITAPTPEAGSETQAEAEATDTAEGESNPRVEIGQVLSSEGDYTTILLEKNRRTITILSDTMTERERCNLPLGGKPLFPVLGSPPEYDLECQQD